MYNRIFFQNHYVKCCIYLGATTRERNLTVPKACRTYKHYKQQKSAFQFETTYNINFQFCFACKSKHKVLILIKKDPFFPWDSYVLCCLIRHENYSFPKVTSFLHVILLLLFYLHFHYSVHMYKYFFKTKRNIQLKSIQFQLQV